MIQRFSAIISRKCSSYDNIKGLLREISAQILGIHAHLSRASLVFGGREKHQPAPCDLFQVTRHSS